MAQHLSSITKKYGNFMMCYVDDVRLAIPTLTRPVGRLGQSFGLHEESWLEMQNLEVPDPYGLNEVGEKNGG